MTPSAAQPDERFALLELANGYVLARALQVAAELGFADALAVEPLDAGALAARLGVSPRGVDPILRLLASHGIFSEQAGGRFTNTPRSELLRSEVTGSVRDALVLRGDSAWWSACADLANTVRTGRYAGPSAAEFYAGLERDAVRRARFDRGMAVVAELEDQATAQCIDFTGVRRIVDIGGGRGGFLAQALRRTSDAHGVLFDTPRVVASTAPLEAAGVRARCAIVGGDFHHEVPQGGDVYVLKRILHSFGDEAAIALLSRCREAMAPGGRILTIEMLKQRGNAPHRGKLADVLLLMLGAEGRERTEEEMRALQAAAGLVVSRVTETAVGLSIVEAAAAAS